MDFSTYVAFTANIFTIAASGIAIYLFLFKRDAISSAFKVLLNYSSQITLSELKTKLEKLNDLNVNDSSHVDDIVNTLNEIVGQVRGNRKLRIQCSEILGKMEKLAENPKRLTEPRKRSIVSELRENLRQIGLANYDEFIGGSL